MAAADAAWRPMQPADGPAALAIAAVVHAGFPERPEVFAERLALAPSGCHVLVDPSGAMLGYAVSHPWRARDPPPLDTLLGRLPAREGTRYLHDVALLPGARRRGFGEEILARIAADARRAGAPSLSLVAVHGSMPFWRRHGFGDGTTPALAAKLASYGPDARFMVMPL